MAAPNQEEELYGHNTVYRERGFFTIRREQFDEGISPSYSYYFF